MKLNLPQSDWLLLFDAIDEYAKKMDVKAIAAEKKNDFKRKYEFKTIANQSRQVHRQLLQDNIDVLGYEIAKDVIIAEDLQQKIILDALSIVQSIELHVFRKAMAGGQYEKAADCLRMYRKYGRIYSLVNTYQIKVGD